MVLNMDGAAEDGAHLFSLGFQLQLWIDSACQLLKARGRQVVTPITHPSRRRRWLDDGKLRTQRARAIIILVNNALRNSDR